VKHVYVHAGGKIEALGTSRWAHARAQEGGGASTANGATNGNLLTGNVETICVVDVRDNNPESTTQPYALQNLAVSASMESLGQFTPQQLIASTGVPQSVSPIRGSKDGPAKAKAGKKHGNNGNIIMTEQEKKKVVQKVSLSLYHNNVVISNVT